MKPVLITLNQLPAQYQEVHDSIDVRWSYLLAKAQLLPIFVPNQPELVKQLWEQVKPVGVILTGGGEFSLDPSDQRSRTEEQLVSSAAHYNKPILGVCRGMQTLMQLRGQALISTVGHINPKQVILVNGEPIVLNSYHNYGTKQIDKEFRVWATSHDGVIKAIENKEAKQIGIMWHPERIEPFTSRNIEFLNRLFVKQEYPCAHLY